MNALGSEQLSAPEVDPTDPDAVDAAESASWGESPTTSAAPTGPVYNAAEGAIPPSPAVQNYQGTGVTPVEALELLHKTRRLPGSGPLSRVRQKAEATAADYSQTQGEIEELGLKGIQGAAKASTQEANAIAPLYEEQARIGTQYALANESLLAKQTELLNQQQFMQQTVNDLANQKIKDPMATASLPTKITALIAMGIGGFAQGFRGLSNNAPADMINHAIDQDIQLQKFNLEHARNTTQMKSGLLSQMLQTYGDMRVATAATKTAYMDSIAKRMESISSQFSNAKTQAGAQQMAAAFLQKGVDARNTVDQHSQTMAASIAMHQETLSQQRELMGQNYDIARMKADALSAKAQAAGKETEFNVPGFTGGHIADKKIREETKAKVGAITAYNNDLQELKNLVTKFKKQNIFSRTLQHYQPGTTTHTSPDGTVTKDQGLMSTWFENFRKSPEAAQYEAVLKRAEVGAHAISNPEVGFSLGITPAYAAQLPTINEALFNSDAAERRIKTLAKSIHGKAREGLRVHNIHINADNPWYEQLKNLEVDK